MGSASRIVAMILSFFAASLGVATIAMMPTPDIFEDMSQSKKIEVGLMGGVAILTIITFGSISASLFLEEYDSMR